MFLRRTEIDFLHQPLLGLMDERRLNGEYVTLTIQERLFECERLIEDHLLRAARSSSQIAKAENLNLAAVYATESERLRSTERTIKA